MENFIYPGILSGIALLVYYFTLAKSGMARQKYKIPAPLHEGPEDYVRQVRVHQNTLEHLALFLPSLWLFSFAVDPIWASIIGYVIFAESPDKWTWFGGIVIFASVIYITYREAFIKQQDPSTKQINRAIIN